MAVDLSDLPHSWPEWLRNSNDVTLLRWVANSTMPRKLVHEDTPGFLAAEDYIMNRICAMGNPPPNINYWMRLHRVHDRIGLLNATDSRELVKDALYFIASRAQREIIIKARTLSMMEFSGRFDGTAIGR